ncbi:iron uptake porin [Myxosarcina sp. GI1(2024)]
MTVQKLKQWCLNPSKSFQLVDHSILLLLPLTLLATSAAKTSASEEDLLLSEIEQRSKQAGEETSPVIFENIENINIIEDPDRLSQVTNINQLRDVEPTDWAYEALRSLVDRYGCIAGFPNQTYRGFQALTRYEFAAGLNSCLNQIERLIALSEAVSRQDLATISRLSEEFAAELATIEGRVDNLEGRVAFLEDNQFSTTTKLTGNIFFNLTGATAGDNVLAETNDLNTPLTIRRAARGTDGNPIVSNITDDPEITFSYYSWINFNTSFTGEDTLVTQLVAGNGNSPANTFISAGLYNTFGVPFTDQTGAPAANSVAIRELFYDFPIGEKFRVVVGPRINWYRYFDNNNYTFFLTGASSYNSSGGTLVNAIDRGSGAVITWDVNDFLTFTVGYLGENTEFLPAEFFNTSSDPEKGLFNATNTITAEVDLAIADRANIRLLYTRSNLDNNQPILDAAGNITGFGVGGSTGEPLYGVADDGFGGTIGDAPADTFAVNFDWAILDWLGVFGRYSYGSTDIYPRTPGRDDGEVNAQAFQAGIAFPDLIKEGSLGTFSFVVPFDVIDGEEFLVSGAGDGGTQYEFELTYFYPVNDNIALVPAFYLVANPNNFEDNPNIYVGNLRMQFSF